VDERKRAEIELYKTQEELRISYEAEKELNELKTRFISMVSHEYRTPLTVILSSTYILDQFYQMQDYRGFSKQIDHIQSAVKSMTEMLEDVLVIGRQESGRVEIFSEKYDIVDLCLEIKDQMEALFKGEHDIVIDSSSPKVYVRTDSKILLHILNNLASNACKYSPKAESVTIKIRESEEEISVSIIDKGIGIPEKEQKSVFEPFFRSHNIGTIPGTGLGLAIVKRFVDMLDARLTLQSKEHEGSTFTLFLKKN
jgi:signal transduction histidine kinase